MKKINYNGTTVWVSKYLPFQGYAAMNLFGMTIFRKTSWERYISKEYYTERTN